MAFVGRRTFQCTKAAHCEKVWLHSLIRVASRVRAGSSNPIVEINSSVSAGVRSTGGVKVVRFPAVE